MNHLRSIVRPAVTLIMTMAVVGGFFLGKLSAEQFMMIASQVIIFWFISRSAEKPKQGE